MSERVKFVNPCSRAELEELGRPLRERSLCWHLTSRGEGSRAGRQSNSHHRGTRRTDAWLLIVETENERWLVPPSVLMDSTKL